jgi:hypothetical protein
MAISDLISTSFLFSIAIMVILIGGIFAYMSYRMSEQDHKLSSMLGLVTTMTGEIQFLKGHINITGGNIQRDYPNHFIDEQEQIENEHINMGENNIGTSKLIHVSDDEEEGDYEDESEDSEEDDSEDEMEEDESSVSEDELEGLEDIEDIEEPQSDDDIKILNLGEMVNDSDDIDRNNIKSIHLEEPIDILLSEQDNQDINEHNDILNAGDLKTITISMDNIGNDISGLENDNGKHKNTDYRKMPLNKLREVATEMGIVQDASKYKKNDLLKLLDAE